MASYFDAFDTSQCLLCRLHLNRVQKDSLDQTVFLAVQQT